MSGQEAVEIVLSYLLHKRVLAPLKQSNPEFYQLIGIEISAKMVH
jgi:hypothetical protein